MPSKSGQRCEEAEDDEDADRSRAFPATSSADEPYHDAYRSHTRGYEQIRVTQYPCGPDRSREQGEDEQREITKKEFSIEREVRSPTGLVAVRHPAPNARYILEPACVLCPVRKSSDDRTADGRSPKTAGVRLTLGQRIPRREQF